MMRGAGLLDVLGRLIAPLWPLRWVAGAAAAAAAVWFVMALFGPGGGSDHLMMPLICLLWALCLWAGIVVFSEVPAAADPNASWGRRFVRHCVRAWYWLLLALMIGTTLAVASFSIRLVRVLSPSG